MNEWHACPECGVVYTSHSALVMHRGRLHYSRGMDYMIEEEP